ncbi:ISSpo9, transposase [Thalassobium sp. R2A62]|nr:ISSpo9, transposase [Thalassobium sp. R2A62]
MHGAGISRGITIASRSIDDAPTLPELLDQMPPDEDIGSVTADEL